MTTALKILGLLAAVIVVAIATVAFVGLPAGLATALLGDRMAGDTGARITINGATRVGLFPLHLTVHDVTIVSPGDDTLRLSIPRIEAAIPVASLLSRQPSVSSVTLTQPVLHLPLLRERARSPVRSVTASAPEFRIGVQRLVINEGAVLLSDPAAKVEQRIDGLSAEVLIGDDRRVTVAGKANLGGALANFTAKTRLPAAGDRQAVPFDVTLDAPGLMTRTLTAVADVKVTGAVVSLGNLSGRLGDAAFNGWASADLSSKPLVKLDLDFPQLGFDAPRWRDGGSGSATWSTIPFDLAGLNYADAQAKFSIADLRIGALRIAPAAIDVTLAAGALKVHAARLGIGGGEIDGEAVIDASGATPDLSLRADVDNVRARPLLNALAGFDRIDGRMTAKLGLRGTGPNPRAVAASLAGTAFVAVKDGEIIGVNLAQMIRSLTASTLNGWQDAAAETTDLSQLSASYRLEGGQGSTSDLMLAGPLVRMTGAGNIDIVSETLAFRVEPKLVMTLQGQAAPGAANPPATPVGLGVPVIVQGPWSAPRIYPEISGMLDNPEAAYGRLREMGQGLFGRDLLGKDLQGLLGPSGGAGAAGQKGLGEAIGNLIQGLGSVPSTQQSPRPGGDPTSPSDPNAPSPMNDIMKRLFSR